MNKSKHFTGQPIFSQLLSFIPKELVSKIVFRHQSDRYCKYFDTWNHLITMLFSCWGHCDSLREVVMSMRSMEGKLSCLGIDHFPTRSTFSDANARRKSIVFEELYFALRKHWSTLLSDSQQEKGIYLIDSTVISLFQEIFKNSGSSKSDGRRKGGLKVHVALEEGGFSPQIVRITDGACNDITFLEHISLPKGSTVIMDRGYRYYKQYNLWTQTEVRFVTRLREPCYWKQIASGLIDEKESTQGILEDHIIELGYPQKKTEKCLCRKITYRDAIANRIFYFLTNDFESNASLIAGLYRRRWAVELLFKRLKQNMPLHYFLGDNQNAIKIQIWCALIADLVLQIIKKQLKVSWAFSSIVAIVRLNLFNYIYLISFFRIR
jgi:hypothetical protein